MSEIVQQLNIHDEGDDAKFEMLIEGVNRVAKRIVDEDVHTVFLLDRSARYFEEALMDAVSHFGGSDYQVVVNFIDPTILKKQVKEECYYKPDSPFISYGGYSFNDENLDKLKELLPQAQFKLAPVNGSVPKTMVVDEFLEYGKSLFATFAFLRRVYPDQKILADAFVQNNRFFSPRVLLSPDHQALKGEVSKVANIWGKTLTLNIVGNEERHVLDDNPEGLVAIKKALEAGEEAARMVVIRAIQDEIRRRVRVNRAGGLDKSA